MVRRAIHRSDGNQAAIVRDLRKAGYTVAVCSHAGDGYPDLHVAKGQHAMLMEVKDPKQATLMQIAVDPYDHRRQALLEDAQKKFAKTWPIDIPIIFTSEEARKCLVGGYDWLRG